MANRIVGLDIGAWAIKAVALDTLQRPVEVVGFAEVRLADLDEVAQTPEPVEEAALEEVEASEDGANVEGEGLDERREEAADGGDREEAGGSAEPAEAVAREPWVRGLEQLIAQGFFEGASRVVVAMPHGEAMTLRLGVPFEGKAQVTSVLPHLLMGSLPMPLQRVTYDFEVMPGKGEEPFDALVGFVESERLAGLLGSMQTLGVDPAMVGISELSLRQAAERSMMLQSESFAVIDFGHAHTRLLIQDGARTVVARAIKQGGQALSEALAESFNLSLDDADRLKHQRTRLDVGADEADPAVARVGQVAREVLGPLVRDLRRTFQSAYARDRVQVETIFICGGGSRLQGLKPYLEREFGVAVMPLSVELSVSDEAAVSFGARQPEAMVALGAALMSVREKGQVEPVNLRQGPFEFRGKSSYVRAQLVRLGIAAAVLVVLGLGVLLMQRLDQSAQLDAMKEATAEQTQALFGERLTSPAAIRARLGGAAGPERGFVPLKSAYELLSLVTEGTADVAELQLDRIDIDTDRQLIQMVGVTDSPQSVDQIAASLERQECLTDARKEKVTVQGDNRVQFEIHVTSDCS
ncbi:hypothetical protein EA187_10155 [Lujinxingia sediminis]|uniref:GspL periplasmic domain-containing protein n=1 Tax=Lujinxingia sediminis TaxID=2480984 RepID=A0ABY0CTM2_9DELT|nr:pilus assembly protein PilM [Lujinxingia sediminis]RVU44890.1 hypothetical protein EA187_10155 [Lujinxingia sediminis]